MNTAAQEARQQAEAIQRQARFRSGMKGVWDHVRGEHKRIQQRNEQEAYQALQRDRASKDDLIFQHIEQRRLLKTNLEKDILRTEEKRQQIALERDTFNQKATELTPPVPKPAQRRIEPISPPVPPIAPAFIEAAKPAQEQLPAPEPLPTPEPIKAHEPTREQRREAFMKIRQQDVAAKTRNRGFEPER